MKNSGIFGTKEKKKQSQERKEKFNMRSLENQQFASWQIMQKRKKSLEKKRKEERKKEKLHRNHLFVPINQNKKATLWQCHNKELWQPQEI